MYDHDSPRGILRLVREEVDAAPEGLLEPGVPVRAVKSIQFKKPDGRWEDVLAVIYSGGDMEEADKLEVARELISLWNNSPDRSRYVRRLQGELCARRNELAALKADLELQMANHANTRALLDEERKKFGEIVEAKNERISSQNKALERLDEKLRVEMVRGDAADRVIQAERKTREDELKKYGGQIDGLKREVNEARHRADVLEREIEAQMQDDANRNPPSAVEETLSQAVWALEQCQKVFEELEAEEGNGPKQAAWHPFLAHEQRKANLRRIGHETAARALDFISRGAVNEAVAAPAESREDVDAREKAEFEAEARRAKTAHEAMFGPADSRSAPLTADDLLKALHESLSGAHVPPAGFRIVDLTELFVERTTGGRGPCGGR